MVGENDKIPLGHGDSGIGISGNAQILGKGGKTHSAVLLLILL